VAKKMTYGRQRQETVNEKVVFIYLTFKIPKKIREEFCEHVNKKNTGEDNLAKHIRIKTEKTFLTDCVMKGNDDKTELVVDMFVERLTPDYEKCLTNASYMELKKDAFFNSRAETDSFYLFYKWAHEKGFEFELDENMPTIITAKKDG